MEHNLRLLKKKNLYHKTPPLPHQEKMCPWVPANQRKEIIRDSWPTRSSPRADWQESLRTSQQGSKGGPREVTRGWREETKRWRVAPQWSGYHDDLAKTTLASLPGHDYGCHSVLLWAISPDPSWKARGGEVERRGEVTSVWEKDGVFKSVNQRREKTE